MCVCVCVYVCDRAMKLTSTCRCICAGLGLLWHGRSPRRALASGNSRLMTVERSRASPTRSTTASQQISSVVMWLMMLRERHATGRAQTDTERTGSLLAMQFSIARRNLCTAKPFALLQFTRLSVPGTRGTGG